MVANVLEVDPALPLHVEPDPLGEAKSVAEPRVDLVLQVRVGVHEAREDHRLGVVLAVAELRPLADAGDGAVVCNRDGAVADRAALHRDDPVGRDDLQNRPSA